MTMIAAVGVAGVVGVITTRHSTGSMTALSTSKRIAAVRAVGMAVHERWMNGTALWVTEKFRGQPCEFKGRP
jgi:hypothetical protein